MSKKVAVVMGSDSDLETMKPCIARLQSFGICLLYTSDAADD